jgi:hypothetical protein
MGWLDRLLGREKKAATDTMGDSSMKREGMHQEQDMGSEGAGSADQMAQGEGESAAEPEAPRDNP